jgi:hypothetical protein
MQPEHPFQGERKMVEIKDSAAFLKDVQARFDRKLKDNELEMLEQWKEHLDRLAAMKPEGVAALQMHIRKVADMMANRIKILKRD